MPFPPFDDKGRAFVDYSTKLDPSVETGYRVLRGTLNSPDGTSGIIQASFRIAPILDFDIVQRNLKVDIHDRSIKMAYYLTSNTIGWSEVICPDRRRTGFHPQRRGPPQVQGHGAAR